jgi:uncharacterized membrane protein YfcA
MRGPRATMPDFAALSLPMLAWIAAVMLLAGFVHGVIGFGFPIVATPLLAAAMDLKVAVVVSLVPTLAMTLVNAFRGGKLRESIGRFWFLPLCLPVGAYIGTRILIVAPSEPFLLVLAGLVLAFLNMERLGHTEIPFVRRHPAASAVVSGVLAGLFEATVNVAGPMLLVYFMLAGLNPRSLVQVLNFGFIVGKGTQIATWTAAGGIGPATWLATAPFALLALVTLLIGHRVHDRVSTATYMKWLRGFLWVMVGMLVLQFIRQWLS